MTTYYGLRLKTNGRHLVIETEERLCGGWACGFYQYLTPAYERGGLHIESMFLISDKIQVELIRNNAAKVKNFSGEYVNGVNPEIPHHYENPDDLEIFEVNI